MSRVTVCRICESACGLVAEVHEGEVTALRPDPEHPVSRGYACKKGTGFLGVHRHPERVLRPRLRGEDVSWEEAGRWIRGRLRELRGSVGLYLGNAVGHSLGAVLGSTILGSVTGARTYSCLTLDNSVMFVVTEACLGNPMRTFVADYAGSDRIVLFGTDPLSSQPSQAQSNPGGVRELLHARERLIVVDPRASATARSGRHLRVRPGTDVALLAYLVREVLRRRPEVGGAERTALEAAVAPFDEGRVAETGVDAAWLAEQLLAAERPLVWSGLGVLLGPPGTVGYWLTLVLQALLTGLDTPGGWVVPSGTVDLPGLFRWIGPPGRDLHKRSRIGGYPAILGTLAAATLADDILTPGPGQLRGLVVVGGNPLVALPDTERAERALASLDLLVCVDLFANATSRFAHAILPAADWLERDEVAVHMDSQRRIPQLQYVRAVERPRGEAREDWDILLGLAGLPRWVRPTQVAEAVVRARAPFGWAELTAAPRGVVGPDRKAPLEVRLAVPEFIAALGAIEPVREGIRLVTSVRPTVTMNSWIRGEGTVATMHPSELERLGSPRRVRIRGPGGELDVDVTGDTGLALGVVVVPFGTAAQTPTGWSAWHGSRPSPGSRCRTGRS